MGSRIVQAGIAAAILVLALHQGVQAQTAPTASPPPAPASPAPAVEAAMRRMSATLTGARSFTMRMTTVREARLADGQAVLLNATGVVAVRRPDHVATAFGSDLGSFAVWYDGSTVSVLNLTENVYATAPLSGDIPKAVDWLEDRLGIAIPIRPIVAADPYAAMVEAGPTSGIALGRTYIGDTAVDHFALRNPAFAWELWLEATPRALPRRVSLLATGNGSSTRVIADFTDWDLSADLAGNAFEFAPPAGATATNLVLRPE